LLRFFHLHCPAPPLPTGHYLHPRLFSLVTFTRFLSFSYPQPFPTLSCSSYSGLIMSLFSPCITLIYVLPCRRASPHRSLHFTPYMFSLVTFTRFLSLFYLQPFPLDPIRLAPILSCHSWVHVFLASMFPLVVVHHLNASLTMCIYEDRILTVIFPRPAGGIGKKHGGKGLKSAPPPQRGPCHARRIFSRRPWPHASFAFHLAHHPRSPSPTREVERAASQTKTGQFRHKAGVSLSGSTHPNLKPQFRILFCRAQARNSIAVLGALLRNGPSRWLALSSLSEVGFRGSLTMGFIPSPDFPVLGCGVFLFLLLLIFSFWVRNGEEGSGCWQNCTLSGLCGVLHLR
jgi:hypothetical protein